MTSEGDEAPCRVAGADSQVGTTQKQPDPVEATPVRSQKTALLGFLNRSNPDKQGDKKFTLLLRSGVFVQMSIAEEDGVSRCVGVAKFPGGTSASLVSADLQDEAERNAFAERLMNGRDLVAGGEEFKFRDFSMKKISALGTSDHEWLWEVTLENDNPEIGKLVLETIRVVVVKSAALEDRLRFRISGSRAEALKEVDRVQEELLRAHVALSALMRDKIASNSCRF